MKPATPLEDILEKEWAKQLFETKKGLATMTGWTLVYHTYRSPRSPAGFPDWVLVRERVIYVELKREKGKPSAEQVVWLDGLARAGAEVYLWKPSDLAEIGTILSRRPTFVAWSAEQPDRPPHLVGDYDPWLPKSIWVPGRGRSDAGVE